MSDNSNRMIFLFGEEDLPVGILGGKGLGLSRMVRWGVPVPPGFTVTTDFCQYWQEKGILANSFLEELQEGIAETEFRTGMKFGDPKRPLLVSVRSGAPVSMPGMMDTVLNVGLNPQTVEGLAYLFGSVSFAWDSYRRFLSMYGETVLRIDRSRFEKVLQAFRGPQFVTEEGQFKARYLRRICNKYREIIGEVGRLRDLDDPWYQLKSTLIAVMQSWNNKRAEDYRRNQKIPDSLGTAINVQAMVFGNHGKDSGTGVVFSRNVSTGESGLYGEFLINAQGEDVVAGIRTPLPIAEMKEWNPALYSELEETVCRLEKQYNDIVDVEFTVESGELYILQVRSAKRTPEAAITAAVHFVEEGTWTQEEAMKKVPYSQVRAIRFELSFDASALEEAVKDQSRLLGKGLPASPGAAVGRVVFTSEEAVSAAKSGEKVILIRPDTSPDDLSGMLAAVAIVTETGGATSHAAVVARSLGKPAVVGAKEIHVKEGQIISVDGATGVIVSGEVPMQVKPHKKEIDTFLAWVGMTLTPPPRLGLEYVYQKISLHKLVNDFYLSDAMAQAALGSRLEQETYFLRERTHIMIAEIVAAYLAVAVAGELRHYQGSCEAFLTLCRKYGVEKMPAYTTYRGKAQEKVLYKLVRMSVEEQQIFFKLAELVFKDGNFVRGNYGGNPWAKIALAGYWFLSGELNHSAFVDHAIDLQHNNGTVFGKHDMLLVDPYTLRSQLEIKKYVDGVENLYHKISYYFGEFSTEVGEMYMRGHDEKWTFSKWTAAA